MQGRLTVIDAYLRAQPDPVRRALEETIACILKAAPEATVMLNYGIPAFALVPGGKRDQQVMVAGYANHVGFYPHPSTMQHYWAALADFRKAKGSVRFPLSRPLPKNLIMAMVRYRKGMLEAKTNKS